jgi:hypothetical protein
MRLIKPKMADGYCMVLDESGRDIGLIIYQHSLERWAFRPIYGAALGANELNKIAALIRTMEDVDQKNTSD